MTPGRDVISGFRIVLVAAMMLPGLMIASPAGADHNQVFELRQRGEILSLVELIERAQAIHPGQLVEARLEEETLTYEITIYGEDDRYHEMHFNARDGRLLPEHAETEESTRDDDHHDD